MAATVSIAFLSCAVLLGACGEPAPDAASAEATPGKVTVTGDSISVGLGSRLRLALAGQREVKVIGEPGTGLARPDSFDWPGRLEQLAQDFPPEVLVFSLSSNDAQDLTDTDGTTVATMADDASWDQEYSRRLARSFDAFEGTGTTVVWVGHVRTQEDRVGERNRHIQDLAERAAEGRDWVVVRDLAQILGTGDEIASDCLVADGLHLTLGCLDRAAKELSTSEPIA